jgi:hypothetical protein
MPTASELGISVSAQCNTLKQALNDIASQEQGRCLIAENIDEKLWMGFDNTIGPKILIAFVGEDPVASSSDVQELVGRVRRHFDVLVTRPKILTAERNTALTETVGPSKSFYELLERIRDTVRCIEWPSLVQNPTEYSGMRPGNMDNWMLDSYIISISTILDIGRVSLNPPEIANGPYIGTTDPSGIEFNKSY